jgi:hypothetical protein
MIEETNVNATTQKSMTETPEYIEKQIAQHNTQKEFMNRELEIKEKLYKIQSENIEPITNGKPAFTGMVEYHKLQIEFEKLQLDSYMIGWNDAYTRLEMTLTALNNKLETLKKTEKTE